MTRDEALKLGVELKRAIIKVAEDCPSDLRGLLHRYLKRISPACCSARDTEFPLATPAHPKNPYAARVGNRNNVVCFYCASAILAYYNLVEGKHEDHEFAVIQRFLELAETGVNEFNVEGDHRSGYELLTTEMLAAKLRAKQEEPEVVEEEVEEEEEPIEEEKREIEIVDENVKKKSNWLRRTGGGQ